MKRIKLIFISIMAIAGVVLASGTRLSATSASPVTAPTADACSACHPKLSEQVPEGHFKATFNEVKNCLACHSVDGAATAFAWTAHKSHYATLGQAAQCVICHEVAADGTFRVIGVDNGKQLKTTTETLTKMEPYYLSWATSSFLDHKHGEQSVTCSTCHDTAFPDAAVKKEKCFTCHGTYEQLAEKSPFHYDAIYPHFGTGGPLECNECHKAHEKSSLACNMCHSFGEVVP